MLFVGAMKIDKFMRDIKNFKNKKCYWCDNTATNVDHVPPKCLFEKPHKYLIKVPACKKHNNCFSEDEEWFRNYVLAVSFSKREIKMWADKAKRSIQRNSKLKNEMKLNLIDINNGLTAIKFSKKRANKVIEKIIRGLYFYHFKKSLPKKINLVVDFNPINNLLSQYQKYIKFFSIQNNSFHYGFMNAEEDTNFSMWWLQFHKNALFVVGITK